MKSNPGAPGDSDPDSQRLDTWLWTSRFFRTRKVANEAVTGGHVWLNGQRCKPARLIRPGDELRIRRDSREFTVEVIDLSPRRLGAPLAAQLYRETPDSIVAREEQAALDKARREGLRFDRRRPGKRAREKMLRIKYQVPDLDGDP